MPQWLYIFATSLTQYKGMSPEISLGHHGRYPELTWGSLWLGMMTTVVVGKPIAFLDYRTLVPPEYSVLFLLISSNRLPFWVFVYRSAIR